MIAVGTEQFAKLGRELEQAQKIKKRPAASLEEASPRVQNKMTLCFYPGVHLPFGVSDLTGEIS